MPKEPFTPAGVTAKTAALYSMNDTDLLDQSKAAATDIYTWLDDNFFLTVKQQTYISSAPAKIQFWWGASIGAALIGRATVTMAPAPDYGPPRRTKEVKMDHGGGGSWFPPISGEGEIIGFSTLDITYNVVD